jgi:hypothetical protein
MPGLRSVAEGFWVGTGSRDEPDELSGASHFLEHLLFKGTADRHAADIAESVESVGGDMNAFTGQEVTAFYMRMPDRHLATALDIMSDIVWSPALRDDEVESERQVIREIRCARRADDLARRVAGALFPATRSDASRGTEATIEASPRPDREYHALHYRPANVVVAVAGNVDHEEVIAQSRPIARRHRRSTGTGQRPTAARLSSSRCSTVRTNRRTVVGTRSLRRDDPDRGARRLTRFSVHELALLPGGAREARWSPVFSYRSALQETGVRGVRRYARVAPRRRIVRASRPPRGRRRRERSSLASEGHPVARLRLRWRASSRMHRTVAPS